MQDVNTFAIWGEYGPNAVALHRFSVEGTSALTFQAKLCQVPIGSDFEADWPLHNRPTWVLAAIKTGSDCWKLPCTTEEDQEEIREATAKCVNATGATFWRKEHHLRLILAGKIEFWVTPQGNLSNKRSFRLTDAAVTNGGFVLLSHKLC